ncbi:MAG: hypothetical protein IPL89_09200 [Acidobacteria bacterium]|nr:hypothetical protein [Acidobacteriota bacterium]
MNTKMRNLTLAAAALAALTVTAPKAAADDHGRNQNRRETPRQEYRERGRGGSGRYEGHRRAYVAPVRPVARYGYGHGYAAPFRIFSGFRFYSAYPGPGYVYIADLGWVVPPFFGAVWIPSHYDVGGYWVDGFWR